MVWHLALVASRLSQGETAGSFQYVLHVPDDEVAVASEQGGGPDDFVLVIDVEQGVAERSQQRWQRPDLAKPPRTRRAYISRPRQTGKTAIGPGRVNGCLTQPHSNGRSI